MRIQIKKLVIEDYETKYYYPNLQCGDYFASMP